MTVSSHIDHFNQECYLPEELQNFNRGDFTVLVTVYSLEGSMGLKPVELGKYLALTLDATLTLGDRDQQAFKKLLTLVS